MADKKGILSKEQEKYLAQLLDEKVEFGNKILEMIDGMVFKAIISLVDDYGLEKLQENYKEKADELADFLLAEDWQSAVVVIWELSAMIVKEYITDKE